MFLRIYFLCCITFIFLCACNKQQVIVKHPGNDNLSQLIGSKLDTSKGWYGSYQMFYQSPDDTSYFTLSDKYIIGNGEAKFPYNPDALAIRINYDIPVKEIIHGDSTTFKLSLKQGSNQILLQLIGVKNSLYFSYYVQNDTGYYLIAVGAIIKQVKVFPATMFNNFKTVKFAFSKNKVFLYVENKLITSFSYDTKNKMGVLKQISLQAEYIECDFVRLYNTYNNKLVMREEFNHDGESHTVFYQ